jgi:tetratricopeptide (TPR) repeat protein
VGTGHSHDGRRVAWGDAGPGLFERVSSRLRALLRLEPAPPRATLGDLPGRLQRDPLAPAYRDADRARDHDRAAATAVEGMEAALTSEDWWVADAWAHRALWHFEQGEMTLEAVRQARRIGDLRWAAGDPASARRYYAEAIDESRDIGAEHEQGLAALGLGRSLLDLGSVSEARRLASASVTLLERSGAPPAEIDAARGLLGTEVAVGEAREEQD